MADDDSEVKLIGRELTMLCRAVTEGWDIPQEMRKKVVSHFQHVIDDPEATHREKDRASKGLIAVEKLRMDAIKTAKSIVDEAPTVVINNNVGSRDTLAEFVNEMSPEQQTEFLVKYGKNATTIQGHATPAAGSASTSDSD
jgi:hypothetical protein